jgi:hypothetical protein
MPGRRYSIKKKHKSSKYRRNIKSHKNKNKSRKNLRTQRGGTISGDFLVTLDSDYTTWMNLYKTTENETTLPKEHYITYKLVRTFYYIVIDKDMTFASYKQLDVPTSINNNQGKSTEININGLTVIEIVNDDDQNKVNKYNKIIDILESSTVNSQEKINSELEILIEQTNAFLEKYKDHTRTLERGNYFIFKISQYNYIAIVSTYNYTMDDLVKLAGLLPQNDNNIIYNNISGNVFIYKIKIKNKEDNLHLEKYFYKQTNEMSPANIENITIGTPLTFENVVIEGITLNNNIPIGVSKEKLIYLYTTIIEKNLTLFNKLSENEDLEIVGEPGKCSQFRSKKF